MIKLPNCVECGNNKQVELVEALGDDDEHTVYRVCCRACGRVWQWSHWYFDPPVSVHVNADRNLSPETANALSELIKLAVTAIEDGTLLNEDEGNICPQCNGTGVYIDDIEPCDYCDGLGYKWWM